MINRINNFFKSQEERHYPVYELIELIKKRGKYKTKRGDWYYWEVSIDDKHYSFSVYDSDTGLRASQNILEMSIKEKEVFSRAIYSLSLQKQRQIDEQNRNSLGAKIEKELAKY